jgi:hypothetical protein
MKLDNTLTIIFGTLTLSATIAAIRYKRSIASLFFRVNWVMWGVPGYYGHTPECTGQRTRRVPKGKGR